MSVLRRFSRFLCTVILTAGLILVLASFPNALSTRLGQPLSVQAQPVRIEDIWEKIYQQLPGLPLENQYVDKETGKVATRNTLLNRLIRYHVYVKGRPVNYRLDWKLTLADYLGANERIEPATYPSGSSLRTNPMTNDIAAVKSLTRAQREALVNALVTLFTGQSPDAANQGEPNPGEPNPGNTSGNGTGSAPGKAPTSPNTTPSPTASPAPSPAPSRFPQLPRPGDARLLQP
jgi:hypothetical protein